MNRKNVFRSRSSRYVDGNHWYSSDYRYNRHKDNNFRPRITSNPEKQIAIEIHNSRVESNRNTLRHDFNSNIRFDSRQTVKRFNNCVETTKSYKRFRIEDPFDSPNPMIKDFRLNDKINTNLVKSTNDLFCQKCEHISNSSLDYSNHLNGETHKSKTVSIDKNPKERDRLKPSDDCNQFQRLFKRFKCKEPIIGLNYIKETETDVFSCDLCKCSGLRPFNLIEHIRGCRHQRNYSAQKSFELKNKKSFDCEKRQTKEKSVCTATQTAVNEDYSIRNEGHINQNAHRSRRIPNFSNSSVSPIETIRNHLTNEFQSERFDSSVKTIENFKTIREICDQMIEYFTAKQNLATNVSSKTSSIANRGISTTQKTSFDCLSSKIKKEN